MKEMIKENLRIELLKRFDEIKTLVEEMRKTEAELQGITRTIQEKVSEDSSIKATKFKSDIIKFTKRQYEGQLMNETIGRITLRAIELYKLAKISDVEVDLDQKDVDFLENNMEMSKTDLYGAIDGKVIVLNETYLDKIRESVDLMDDAVVGRTFNHLLNIKLK